MVLKPCCLYFLKIADHWLTCKKLAIDPVLAEKLKAVVVEEIQPEMVAILETYFTAHNEWDETNAGKILPVAETVCRWIGAVEGYYTKEKVCA